MPSATVSTAPSTISHRARPYHAPTTRPAPIVASATATYPDGGTRAPARSMIASNPMASNATDTVIRPSRDRGRWRRGGSGSTAVAGSDGGGGPGGKPGGGGGNS